ncbi:hypothetical protein CRUP_027286 [Coryphaenoides rupestris]|nr:hypothetical protein CRUP_027286 [Coryphaenoides rupestris]
MTLRRARLAAVNVLRSRPPGLLGPGPGPHRPPGPPGPPGPRHVHVEAAGPTKTRRRTIDDLPGPSTAQTAYWLFIRGYADRSHAMQTEHRRLYGPIWRSQFGPFDMVNVASAELIAQVVRQEGRYPAASNAYAGVIHQVVGDLIGRVELLRQRSPEGDGTVSNLQDELYKFGFEGISAILFETRLGCLSEEVPRETLRFIAAVNTMLTLSETVIFLPRWTRRVLPFWGRFVQAWDDISDVANALVDRKLRDLAERAERGEEEVGGAGGGYLTHLLSSDTLPLGEIYTSATELLLGGVDTTSNTLSWALYQLSRDARVQDRLHREVVSVCPGHQEPSVDHLTRMPYLKAVVKETLRMYPVVPGNGRLAVENDVYVGDYWFPKGRWLRDRAPGVSRGPRGLAPGPCGHAPHPYSSIPFGVGVRACLGKRVAELEMFFTLSRLMQHYEVLPKDPDDVPKTRTLMIPGKPIDLRFLPRA